MKTFFIVLTISLTSVVFACVEEKKVIHEEFIPTSFNADRGTVGKDQVEPLKQKILDFVNAQADVVFTDVSVTSSSSKIPFYITQLGKKKIDPESNNKNIALAREREKFVLLMLQEIQKAQSKLDKTNLIVNAELSGPDFTPMDLNTRFLTKMSKDYNKMIKNLYHENKKIYQEEALIKSESELLDENKFVNYYQAKFKPFEGFRLMITGQKKCSVRPGEMRPSPAKTSRQ